MCIRDSHHNILPSWLSRERTATRYSRRSFQGCLRQARLRMENPAKFLRQGKTSPARTRLPCAANLNATERPPFYWTPPARPMPTKTGKRKPGQVFPSRKNSSQHAQNVTASQNLRNERNNVLLNSRHVLCQPRLGRENPAKFFPSTENSPPRAKCPARTPPPQICLPPASRPPT